MSQQPPKYEQEFIQHELAEWAQLVDERLKAALNKKDVGISDEMRKSLAFRIAAAAGTHRGQYKLIFHEYGRFVDMGKGRLPKGLETMSRKQAILNKGRKPKKWYSKTFYGSLNNLIERLVKNYSAFVVKHLKELENNSLQP